MRARNSLASVHPETLSFWNRWLNTDFRGRGGPAVWDKLRVRATAIRNDPHRPGR